MDPSERRIFRRLQMKINIRYGAVPNKSSQKQPATALGALTDLSAGGLAFIAREAHKIASVLQIGVELPLENECIECVARVVRCDPKGEAYRVAVLFLDLASRDRARIEQFVEKEL